MIDIPDYCRQIEAYLCQKNDGHLIRIVGPSFELVSRWAADGVPLNIAIQGIERYFERYYRNGPKRRPVRIDFCEADVLDSFDAWRRATGIVRSPESGDADDTEAKPPRTTTSLPDHLTRVVTRLTQARLAGTLDASADPLIDALSQELDRARASARGVRGDARAELLARLSAADADLMSLARRMESAETIDALTRDADSELAPFRAQMTAEAYQRAHGLAVTRLLRDRLRLPVVAFSG